MKKFSIFVAFLLLGIVGMQAAPVDVAKARKVADRYVRISGLYDKTQKVNRVVDITSQTSYSAFYVFRIEGTRSGKGFVLVSADDIARPVLGYSAENDFVAEGMPEHVAAWLQGYENEILRAREAGVVANEYTRGLWDGLLEGNREMANSVVVPSLVQTRWNQSPRYNNLCPYDSTQNARSVTGCVATAMAQLMKYWNRPVQGTGSHSYTSDYGTLSANFGATTYDWTHMPVKLTSSSTTAEINAVATLMYHCGVAVEMEYSPSGSGDTTIGRVASWYTAECALFNYFGYNNSLQGRYMSSYSTNQWKQMLMNDLDAGRPIIYRGSSDAGGHCFICDGYDSDTNFHFNFGWGGSSDGFYSISALEYNVLEYNGNQGAIMGIYPNNMPLMTPSGVQVSGVTMTGATVSWINPNNTSTTQVQVAYGPAATFDTSNSGTYTLLTSTNNTTTISGLNTFTQYSVALRSVAGSTFSAWTPVTTFTTLAAPQPAPTLINFESGFPAYWTQEYVSGTVDWARASGGYSNHPSGALSGSYNLRLQTNSYGSITRYVSPMLQLVPTDGREYTSTTTHKMAFGHAQDQWAGDVDHLYVYYRTAPTGDWTLLTSYTDTIANWQRDTVTLPNPTGTYQVCFEGRLNYSYGVVLDDISFFTETEVNDSIVVSDVILACDSYTVTDNNGTRTFTQTGTYRLVYTAVSGIDSIILRTVVIGHPTHNSTTVTEIGRYIWHDVIYTESGTYTYNYTNNYGCACADTLHLTIVPCTTEYRNQYVEACDEYTWSNYVTYYESTNDAYDTLTVDGGCPLIMRLNLTIYHSTHNNYSATAMNTYTWHDSLYFETGAFPYHYNDVHNCPSADTLHLTITPAPAVVVDSLHPYHENFEGDFTWYLQSGTAVNRWAYGTATANGGTHALYISNDRGHTNHYDITKRSIAYASKLFTLGRGTHYIGYDWKCYGENNYDYLRVFLAPASAHFNGDTLPSGSVNASTSTYITTVPNGWIGLDDSTKLNLQSNWQSFTAEANVTTPGDYRLVFLWICDNSVGTDPPVAIDDITIELINCGRPSNLAVNDIHTTTATVSWIGTGTQYQVAYGTGTDPDQMTLLTTTDSTATLTGLSGSTTYHVYVRNICSPTLSSAWSGMATFTTPFPPVVVDETHPFNDGFENPCTWWLVNGNRTNCWYWGTAASNGGSHSIYISNNSGNNNSYNNGSSGVTYATKLFALKSGTYHVAYDWRANGERTSNGTNYDYLRVFLAPGTTSVTAGTTLPNGSTSTSAFANVTPNGWIAADSNLCKNNVESWQHFESDVAIPDSGDYVLLFVWITDGNAGNNPPAAIDNVTITRPSCVTPNNLTVTAVTASSATLAWAGNGNNYRIAYGSGNNPDGMSQVNATGTTHTLTNLSPNTLYNIYVRGVCDNNVMTAWAGPVEIATPCTPYTITTTHSLTEYFENGMPGCWRTLYPCDNNAIIVTSTISEYTSYNNSHSLRFSSYYNCGDGYYQYFTSQEISCAAPMQLSFHYRDYNENNHLWVGYSTTGNSPEHFTSWVEVPNSGGEWTTFSAEVPLGTKYVSFRYHGNNSYYSYIDDIELRWARYLITAVSSDNTQGTVSGSSTRNYNATATIRAFPTACYQFSHWNDGNTNNPRTVTVTQDSTFTAYFTPATLTGSETVAACESYRWGGTTYRNGGTYTRHVTTAAGCDSVATLHLTIASPANDTVTDTACESYTWHGRTLTESGTITDTLTTVAGCDSIVTLNLTVNHGTFNSTTDTSHVIPYSWHDNFYSASGTYTYSYTNAGGCASVDTLHLVLAECEAISIMPFTESFEGYTAHAFNLPCWHRFTTTQYPMVAGSGHTGSRGLLWVRTNTPRQYLILPRINTTLYPIDTLQLSMWARGNFYSPVEVGVMTLNGDTSTFTTVGTLNMSMGSNWTERTLPLSPYTGNGQYIALRISGTNSGNLYIDDITVSIAPTCFAPESIAISNITHNSAAVAWNDTAASYVVAYGTGTTPEGMDSVVVSTPSTLLTGLTPNTQYHLFIRSVCSSNNRSEWSGMYTFQTECVSLTMPYIENFESYNTSSYSSSTFPVTCWHRISNGTTYYSPYVSNSTIVRHVGNRGLYWNMAANAAYGTSQYAILPGLDTSFYPTSRHQLSFWRRANTSSQRPVFIIGVMSDPNDTNTFVPVDTVNITSTAWTKDSVSLENYTGHGNHIAICARANGSWVAGMDDLRVSVIPICFPPTNIATGTVTTNSATLSWTGTAGTYKVAYGLGNDPEVMDSVIVTGNSTTLTGLSPATTYNVFFQGICGNERSAWSTSFSFTTACGLVTQLPITQGFEGYPSGNESTPNANFGVPCWTHINNGSVYTGSPYIVTNSHHTGSRAIWWQVPNYNNAQYPTYQMLVLPGIDNTIDLRELRLTFWSGEFFNHNANSIFYVGVMTDPNNVNTFTQVASVPLVPIGSSGMGWNEYHVDLNTYTGSGRYVALRAVRTGSYWGAAMDDITLDYIPPTPIDTVAVACDSFTWNNTTYYTSGNYTRPHTEHNITVYDTLHLTINHGTHNVEYDTAEASYTWHGTTYNTTGVYTYNYTNTEGCASTDTLYLEIIDPYAPVLVDETHPFFDGFENGDRWQKYHGELPNKWFVGTATSRDGANALYVSNNNGMTNEYTITSPVAIFAAKSFILPTGHYYFSYDWKGYGESTYDFLRVALAPASALLTPGTNGYSGFTNTQVPSGWIPLDGNLRKNLSNTWQTYTAEANITTAGIYQMVFYWRNDNSQGTQPPAGVDNVNIIKSSCVRPTNVAASNITETTATLTWNGTASSYQVAYGTMESINEMTMQTANGTTLQLSGLSPSNNYNVYVRAICASEQSPWSNIYSFTTNCGALTALPYMQGFEESTSGSSTSFNVNCWSRYTSSGNYPYVTNSSAIAHTGSKSLYWYSSSTYTQYIVMPEVETAILPINSLRLKFWTKTSSTSIHPTLVVGVMTNPTDISTFAPIQSIDCSGNTDYREHIINLNSYTGTGRYIAIRAQATNTWTVYVDDFTLEAMPSCPEPTNITTIATTTTTATVAWTGMNANSYTVAYGTGTNPNSMDTVRVNAAMATLTGLSASTEYHLYVRANCIGEHSNWSALHTFRTQCGLITTLPYIENINSATTSSSVFDIPCWQRLASSYYPYATTTAGRSGAGLTWYCPNTTGAYQYAILPAFDTNLHPIRTLKLTFWARSSSNSYQPRLQVGVMNNPMDTHSFTPIGTIDIEGTAWTEQTVYFNTYTGNGINIALRGVQTSSNWYAYLDDFTIDVAPICIEPTGVTASAITATSAHLSWTGSGTSYTVAYGTGVSPTGMTTQTTTATTLDLTGLTPNTEYNVFVRSECTGGLQSEWSDIYTFRTECNAITTLPYNEGFEGYPITSNIMPDFAVDCWKRHTNGTTTYIPYTYAIAHTGNRGLFWSLNYSASYGSLQTVVLPSFEVPGQPVNTLQLTFWARGSAASATGTFQVGVMTDPYDTTTFTPISTLTVAGSTWMEYTTLLNTYNGTGTHIALRHNNSSNDDVGSAYFDDFSVTVAPTCDTVVPVVTTLAVCESHTWHGQTYTATGTYTFDTLVGTCSRTDTLHLTVNHGTHNVVVDTACESYTWHGQSYTAAGVYTYNYTNADGCASTDTLHLTVNHGTHDVVVDTACESYTWQGQAYTATGVYTYNYTNADGCASTDTLHLTINHGTHNSVTEMVDESYTWHGSTYTATGIYTYDYTNADGCPSTDTLHLTVDPYMPVLVNETHPFNDGFEGNTLRWQLFNGSQTNKWYRGAAAHSNGSNALYVSNDNGATNAYSTGSASTVFATKKFILPAGHFYFSYDWRANGENNYDYMRVYLTPANTTVTAGTLPTGVSTTGTPTGWTVLDRGRQMNMSTDWSNYTAEVNITDSAIYQVVFIWNNDYSVGNQPPAGIDEVTFIKSDCYSPTGIAASNITDATATLSWTGNATSYMVVYGTSTAIGDMDTVVVAGNTTTLTGLAHTTTHYVYVKSICSATDFSPWSSVYSFRTACGAIALPYSYGIDDPSTAYYNTMLAECWTAGNSGDNANNDPSVSTYYAHDGALSLYMTSSNAYYSYVVLPRFDNPVNRTQMTFWGRAANNSNLSTVEIGVVNSPSDMSSFVLVDTAYFLNSGVLNWHEKEVVFDTYTGNGQYIAIRLPNTGNGRVYLDDFTVEAMPECSGVRNLAVTATTENSVTLTWRETGAGSAWSVEYGPQGFAQGSGTLTTVSTTTATITGLTNNTWYDFYVHSDCAHSTSVARMISAQTDCGRMAIPFLEDFNRYAGSYSDSPIDRCWYKCYSQNNSQTSYPQFTYNSSDNSNIFLSFTSTRNYYSYLVLPYMQGNIHDQMLRFKAITSGGNTANIQVGVMTDATNFNTFQQVQQLSVSSNSEWVTLNVPFNSLSGANYRIAIVSPRMNYSGNPSQGFYVDDVEVVPIPDCNAPTSLAASNITTTGATLHWNAATGISHYRVVYTPYGDYDSTYSVTVDSVSGTSLTLTGLQMGNTYNVEVYSLCVTGSLSMAATTTFSTSCAAHSVPFTENFDHGNGTYVSPCWSNGFYGSSTASYPSVNSAYPKYDGDKSLLFWSSSQNMYSYAVLPTLDDTLSLLQLSLFTAVASNQTHQLQIGTVAASGDITTFQNVQSLNLDNYWRTYTVSLSSVTNNSRRIAIRYLPQNGSQTANIFVDDIVVERIPACDGPARVRVDNILYNQSRAYWPAVTGVASYNLEYGPTGFTLGQGTQVTGITDTSYLLTGLTAGTAYSVYLTAACSSTSQSSMVNWSFSTGCLEELPYEYGFEGLTTSPNTTVSTVPCWFLNENAVAQVNRYTADFAPEGYARMRFNISNASAYAVMPKLDDTISNLYMTLQVNIPNSYNSSETANLVVGVVSNPYDFTTFIPVDTLTPTATDTWESHTVNFSHVVDNSNSYYIAFYSTNDSWYNSYVFFDDIRVMRIAPFNIDLTVAEPARGTVSINGVATNHAQALAGSNVTLSATANHGYTFSHWAAGITDNPYTFVMPDHDVMYNHIVFSLNTYTVTVVSNDTTLGTVTGGGTFDYLDTTTLTATANGIHTFLRWSDGVAANPRTLVVTDDTTITAIFQNNCPTGVDTTVVACDSYSWHDNTYSTSGVYAYQPYPGICTTADTLRLTVNSSVAVVDTQTACESFRWINGVTYTASTHTPTVTLATTEGCDSTVTLNLTINYHSTENINRTTCDSTTFHGNTYYYGGTYYFDTVNEEGCDHLIALNLTLHYGTHENYYQNSCGSYSWNGTTYTATGTYTYNYTNTDGCASTDTLHLVIDQHNDTAYHVTACDGYRWNDSLYTQTGVYTYNYSLAGSTCTNVDTLYLTVNHSAAVTLVDTACDSYTWHDSTYVYPYPSGYTYPYTSVYTYATTTAAGCDSVETLHLTLKRSTTGADIVTACDSYTWIDGNSYTASTNTATHTLTAANGCDSVVTLFLTVNNSSTTNETIVACDSYTWHGRTRTVTGVYTFDTVNAAGCDSTVTLNLTINHGTTSSMTAAACDSYTWHDSTYTATGVYTFDTLGANGCNNTETLTLTVYYGTYNNYYDTAELHYTWHGTTYDTTGDYTYTYANADGCPSTDTLHLVIDPMRPVLVDETHPFFDDFEEDLRWNFTNGECVNRWYYGTAVASTGTHSIYISEDNGVNNTYNWDPATNTYSYVYASKRFILTPGAHSFSYEWHANGVVDHDYLRVFLAPDAATLPATFNGTTPTGWIALDGDVKKCGAAFWTYYAANVNVTTAGIYKMVFVWRNESHFLGSGHNPAGAVDNVSIVKTTCTPPTNLHNSDITTTSATVAWTGTGTRYTVAYGIASTPSDMDTLSVTGNSIQLTGLSPSSEYHLFVRKWCGDSQVSAWSAMYTFQTSCGALSALPYTEDFESFGVMQNPNYTQFTGRCWTTVYNNASPTPRIRVITDESHVHSGTNTLSISYTRNDDFYLVMPQLDTHSIALNNLYIGFWAYPSRRNVRLVAGVMNNPYDTASFDVVDTLDINPTLSSQGMYDIGEYGFSLRPYMGTGSCIALRPVFEQADSEWSMGISFDDFIIDYLPQPIDTTVVACENFTWGDSVYTTSGIHTRSRLFHGITVVDTLRLTIHPSTTGVDVVDACDSLTWIDGVTYRVSTSLPTYTVTDIHGCDSVVTLNLTIHHPSTGTDVITTCDRYTWVNGITYTTNNYGSTYTLTNVAGCDSTLILDLTINHSTTGSESVTVCDIYSWHGILHDDSGVFTFDTTNTAGCDSTATLTLTVNHRTAGSETVTACDSYTWQGMTFDHDTTLNSQLSTLNSVGCDSTVTLTLTVNHSTTGTDVQTACNSFTWIDGVTYTASTDTATYTLTNAEGCDSVVTLDLTINNSLFTEVYDTACEQYIWLGNPISSLIYDESGDYSFNTTATTGCDSTVTLHLTIHHGTHDNYYQHACDTFTWHGTAYTVTGTYLYEYTNDLGCASTDTLHLTVDQHSDTAYHVTLCDSVYRWNDSVYTESGIYIYDYSLAGSTCTNVDTLYLTLNRPAYTDIWDTACDGYNWVGTVIPEGDWYHESGTYTRNLQTIHGCDSVATLHLTIHHSSTLDTTLVACDTLLWTVGDTTFSIAESGDYIVGFGYFTQDLDPPYPLVLTQPLTNAEGCDSTQLLHVTINHSYPLLDTAAYAVTACDSYLWHGTAYSETGVYTFDTVAANGCDSTLALDLTLHHSSTGSEAFVGCDSFSWHDSTYTATGLYTFDTVNAAGCDSTVTLDLTVNYGQFTSTYQAACDSFAWHDTVLTLSGSYLHYDLTAEGCLIIDTLVLTLSNGTSTGYHVDACDRYVWNGMEYTETGNYIYDYSLLGGDCENVDTLYLTIHRSANIEVFDTACDSYLFVNDLLTEGGDYYIETTTAFGCDSVVVLHLTLHYNSSTAYTDSLGADGTYTWHGVTYTESGIYTYDYFTDEGCASTDTLYLIGEHLPVYYTIHASSSDTSIGYVVVYPDTVLMEGSQAFVVGVGRAGYRFSHWDDGDTSAARIFFITSDTTFVAYYEVDLGIAESETPEFRLWTETGALHVEGTGINGMPVRVYDLQGRMLYDERADGEQVTINTARWATGVYLVRVGNLPAQRIVLR